MTQELKNYVQMTPSIKSGSELTGVLEGLFQVP